MLPSDRVLLLVLVFGNNDLTAINRVANAIVSHLKKTSRVFSREQLAEIFFSQREAWRLPKHMTLSKFIDELIGKAGFQEIEVKFDTIGQIGRASCREEVCQYV